MAVRVPAVMRRIRSTVRGRPRLPARLSPRRARIFAFLGLLGPGLIAANAGNDAGGIITYASAGAQFGYRTIFFMVLVTVALVVVQEMCSRLGTFTGKGLAALIREEFSIRLAMSVVVLASLSYLGFGSTAMSWGRMIYENQGALSIQPWAVLAPVILIGMFLVGANMLRDGITRRAGTT